MGEYYGASLNYKDLKKNIHKTKKLKKECTDRNNRQNNDLFGVTRVTGLIEPLSKDTENFFEGDLELLEKALNAKIDSQNSE